MVGHGERIARRIFEIVSFRESVDEAMADLEPLLDPEIEWVNPADAIEGGIRKGLTGMRTVIENFIAGAGTGATLEIMEVDDRGDRVFVLDRIHARGASSGASVVGPPVGVIFTFRHGRALRIEWHYDVEEARARFEHGQ